MFRYLTQPVNIGSLRLRNRMVQPGMGTNLASATGTASDVIVDYYARRAGGGVGLIITEVVAPESRGRVIPGEMEISSLTFVPSMARIAAAVHAGGAKVAMQLAHGGCFASQSVTGEQPITPSSVGTMLLPADQPRTMTLTEIWDLIETYGQAAKFARMAGFDAVEIHGAHGYLPLQFLSGYTNKRMDEFGGSFENRARFGLEVIRSIKRQAGADFPVIYRLSAEEDVPQGVTLEQAVRFSGWAEQAGVDALHISAGTWDSRMANFFDVTMAGAPAEGKNLSQGVSIGMWVPPHYVPRGNLVRLAAAVKQAVTVPVIAVGGLNPAMGEEVLASGQADLISMGRQALADPDYPNKVMTGRGDEIRPCVRCNECLGSVLSYRGIDCTVNPEAGKEHEMFGKLLPAPSAKKVMVIGGGPAGMEAARAARVRGHQVTLYEKGRELGGMLRFVGQPSFKKDYLDLLEWQKSELVRLGVEVKLGQTVTRELVCEQEPDAVILANGAQTAKADIAGAEQGRVYRAMAVLGGLVPEGRRVIVVGGGLAGTDVALVLAEQHGKAVTLVEPGAVLIPQVEIFTQWAVQGRLAEAGVQVRTGFCVDAISPTSVECACEGQAERIEGDAVVVALSKTMPASLDLSNLPMMVITVGDAVEPRKVFNAMHEGYHAGRRV